MKCPTSWCVHTAGHTVPCARKPRDPHPPSLFDDPTIPEATHGVDVTYTTGGDILKARAVAQVDANAYPEWKSEAMLAVRTLVVLGHPFTTDDVWEILDVIVADTTHEPRAMGAIMLAASRAGLIRPTDRYRNSTRPECHSRPVRIWEPRSTP